MPENVVIGKFPAGGVTQEQITQIPFRELSRSEIALRDEHSPEKYRDIVGSMLEEVARLTAMIDTLLTIAHADSGAVELHRTTFKLSDLVQDTEHCGRASSTITALRSRYLAVFPAFFPTACVVRTELS